MKTKKENVKLTAAQVEELLEISKNLYSMERLVRGMHKSDIIYKNSKEYKESMSLNTPSLNSSGAPVYIDLYDYEAMIYDIKRLKHICCKLGIGI